MGLVSTRPLASITTPTPGALTAAAGRVATEFTQQGVEQGRSKPEGHLRSVFDPHPRRHRGGWATEAVGRWASERRCYRQTGVLEREPAKGLSR